MESRIMQVFYGNDCLPYKDSARSVHYPIVGNSFVGANNTTQIRFYVRDIGGVNNVTWVAISKLPNGKIGNQVLSSVHLDSELNEYYVALDLSSYYTQLKGDVYISLNGYQGGVQVSQDAETGIYSIVGTPTIEATGSIKLAINYSTQLPLGQHFNISDLQQVLGAMSDKANVVNTVQVVANISQIDLSGYDVGQLFYDLATKTYCKKNSTSYEMVESVGVLANNNVLVRYNLTSPKTVSQMWFLFDNRLFVLRSGNYDYLYQVLSPTNNVYTITAINITTREVYHGENLWGGTLIQNIISDQYKIEYVERTNNANKLYGTDASGNQITIAFDDLLRNYINVVNYQENVSVIIDPLTNINGWVLSNYESQETTIGGYPCYKITRSGSNLTEEQAKTYLKAMTGSEFLPKYDYERPQNSFMLMPNGLFLKPQYSAANGLVLYKTKRFADVEYVNNAIDSIKRNSFINVDTSEYPTLQDFLDNYDDPEEGHIYLYPIDPNDIDKGYYQYIWEDNQEWEYLGTTQIDLSDYALTSYVDNRDNYIIGLCNNLYYELGQTNDEIDRLAGLFSLYGSYYVGGHTLYVDTATISDNTITLVGTVSSNTLSVTPVTSFYTKTETDTLLNGKVDKTNDAYKVYGTGYGGTQVTIPVDDFYDGNIARRNENGSITIPLTPSNNGDAASKQYVDGMAHSLVVSMNNSTYVITFTLKDKNDNTLSTQTVDLPLESVVVDGDYDQSTKSIVLTLDNGNTITIPVADLVDGLVSNNDLQSALSNYYTKAQIDAINSQRNVQVETLERDIDKISQDFYADNYVVGATLYSSTSSVSSNTLTISGTISNHTVNLGTSLNFYTKVEVDQFGKSIEMSLDNQTYDLSISLKDKNGNVISTDTVSLPLDSIIVDGSYDDQTQSIVLELDNGNTISIPVSDLVSGLVNTSQLNTTLQSYATKQELQSQNTALQNELNSVKLELDNLASLLNLVVDNFITNHILYSKTTTISTNTATIVGTISGSTLSLTTSAN